MAAIEDVTRFHVYAYFVSVDPSKNRRRFYAIAWQEGLWDGGAIVCSWGRIGTKGRTLATGYPDRASAQEPVEKIVRRRLQRGYKMMAFE